MSKRLCFFCAILVCAAYTSGCQSCSRSGQIAQRQATANTSLSSDGSQKDKETPLPTIEREKPGSTTVIEMRKVDGVYQVPVEVNGQTMGFIFDTGAGSISISSLEATFLFKQGLLSKEDITGTQQVSTATGEISQVTVINLRKVKIGDRELQNVSAVIIDNISAPLLLGQSALEQFGKFSVDYKQKTVTFD